MFRTASKLRRTPLGREITPRLPTDRVFGRRSILLGQCVKNLADDVAAKGLSTIHLQPASGPTVNFIAVASVYRAFDPRQEAELAHLPRIRGVENNDKRTILYQAATIASLGGKVETDCVQGTLGTVAVGRWWQGQKGCFALRCFWL